MLIRPPVPSNTRAYTPITELCVMRIVNPWQDKMTRFLEETGIFTLEEILAKVRIFKNQVYILQNPLDEDSLKRIHGYGSAFVRMINEDLLKVRFGPDHKLEKVPFI